MSDCYIVRRGGGAALAAIGAESASELPAAASDGLIAVISSVWPRVVYAGNEEPNAPVEGDVWIQTGVKSTAPIRKGSITVYPSIAMQYRSGAWHNATCYVRYNGEWAPLELWLFETGNAFEMTTGGWKIYAAQSHTSVNDVGNIVAGKNIVITLGTTYGTDDANSQYNIAVGTSLEIPAGKYKRMFVKIGQTYDSSLRVGFARGMNGLSPAFDGSVLLPSGGEKLYELDLSALPEDYEGYLFVHAKTNYSSRKDNIITLSQAYLSN